MTDLTKSNFEVFKSATSQNTYYSDIDLNNELEIKQKLQERSIRTINEKDFFRENRDLCIRHFHQVKSKSHKTKDNTP